MINSKQLEQIAELENQLAELKKRYDNVGKSKPQELETSKNIEELEELEEIEELEELEEHTEKKEDICLTETPKSPEILAVEREAKRNGVVTLNFDEELSPMEKKIVGAFKKLRKPKKKEVEEEKVEEEVKEEKVEEEVEEPVEEIIEEPEEEPEEEPALEEKKYTQEIEEEPLLDPFEDPLHNIALPEKTHPKPQERQIQQEKPKKFEQNFKFLEKEDLSKDFILLEPFEDFVKVCPVCNTKVKKLKVQRKGVILTQLLKCKNKKCNFQKEFVFEI
jgi:hypothetical protein